VQTTLLQILSGIMQTTGVSRFMTIFGWVSRSSFLMFAQFWELDCDIVRNMLTHYRFGPYYLSRSWDFGKRGSFILEADEALVVVPWEWGWNKPQKLR
jgi:hypothetical protein